MVEHSAVNRGVVGSSPTRGVLIRRDFLRIFLFCHTTLKRAYNNFKDAFRYAAHLIKHELKF